jgi:glycine cleavage system H protein
MSHVPADLKYSDDHVWVRPQDGSSHLRVGITDYAQEALGDIIALTLPDLGAGVQATIACADVESTKSVSDIVAPVSGTVVARNDVLEQTPETINSSPYDEGWLFDIEPEAAKAPRELESLKDSAGYSQLIGA